VDAVEALLVAVRELGLPLDHHVELVVHPVGLNWRQLHPDSRSRVVGLDESLLQPGPFRGRPVRLDELRSAVGALGRCNDGLAVSVTSRVHDAGGVFAGHLALMNLHPAGFTGTDELCDALRRICPAHDGLLLSSGRFFHYYGFGLLGQAAWTRFLAQFLMPCALVSPRYIGHSLYRGFCSLRLNQVPPHKATAPYVVRRVEAG
jgi:hypothetical protein